MIANSGFLTALECIKFVFGRGTAPDITGGAYSAPPGPLAGLKGPASNGSGGEGKGEIEEKGRGEGKRKIKGTGGTPPSRKFLDPPLLDIQGE